MSSILKVDTIQDQSGNNIINESGNVITIGASGDTITVPAGATVSGFTSAGIDDNATSVAITIDSNENVGIGSTTPSNDAWSGANSLVIKDTSGDNGLTIISSSATNNGNIAFADSSGGSFSDIGGLITYLHNGDSMRFMTANTERMRINSTGVGIGTSSPANTLDVNDSAGAVIKITRDSQSSYLQLSTSGSDAQIFSGAGALKFKTGSSEAARFDTSGNLLLGATSVQGGTANTLQIADGSSARLLLQNTGGGRTYGFFAGTDGKYEL